MVAEEYQPRIKALGTQVWRVSQSAVGAAPTIDPCLHSSREKA